MRSHPAQPRVLKGALGAAKRNLGQCWPIAEGRRMLLALAHGALPAKERGAAVAATKQIWAEPCGVPRSNNCRYKHKFKGERHG